MTDSVPERIACVQYHIVKSELRYLVAPGIQCEEDRQQVSNAHIDACHRESLLQEFNQSYLERSLEGLAGCEEFTCSANSQIFRARILSFQRRLLPRRLLPKDLSGNSGGAGLRIGCFSMSSRK